MSSGSIGRHRVEQADAVTWLEGLSAGSADLIVVDPGVPGRAGRGTGPARSLLTPGFPVARLAQLSFEVRRVLSPAGLVWWVAEAAGLFALARLVERWGWSSGAPIVWDRGVDAAARFAFVVPLSAQRARSPGPEVVVAPSPGGVGWPGALPEVLCRVLVDSAAVAGQRVVDPFMGSGAVGAAAVVQGCDYVGADSVGAARDAVAKRLGALGSVPFEVDSQENPRPVEAWGSLGLWG